jgi:hypothetical protein
MIESIPVNGRISVIGNQDDFHILVILLRLWSCLLYRDELTTERVDQITPRINGSLGLAIPSCHEWRRRSHGGVRVPAVVQVIQYVSR